MGIIRDAERAGKIKPGDLLVDLTSGNTGIGIAAVAAAKGYRTKFYLRDTISEDKINILRQFGSEIVLIDNDELLEPGALQRCSIVFAAKIRALTIRVSGPILPIRQFILKRPARKSGKTRMAKWTFWSVP